ncbi:MAG: MFS transporter [Enhygromyxa sp.]
MSTSSEAEPASEGRDDLLVWVIVASQFAPPFMFSGVAVALPKLGVDLGAGATALGLVESLFLAGSVALLLPVGRLADATDRRRLFKLGLLVFGLLSVLLGALSSVPLLLAVRFLQGACSALLGATGPALVADLVPAHRRGKVYGASIGVIYAGLTLGPICAGLIVDAWSWRGVFFVGAALLMVMYVLVELRLPSSWRRPTRGAVHLPSAALILASVLSLVFGTASIAAGPRAPALLGAGVLLAVVFVVVQRRIERPLLDIQALVAHRVMRAALFVQLLLYMSAFCSTFMLSIYMQVSLGHPAKTSGGMLSISAVLMAALAPVAGALADRLRPGVIAGIGVALVLSASLLATGLGPASSLTSVGLVLAVQGVGFALFSSPNMTIIMNSAAEDEVSMASALGAKSRSLGMISGMLVTSLLIAARIGNEAVEEHPIEFVGIVVTAFRVLAVSNGLALLVALVSGLRSHGQARRE